MVWCYMLCLVLHVVSGTDNCNNTLLHDLDFVKQLKTVIKEKDHLEDKGLMWEIVKLDNLSFSILLPAQPSHVVMIHGDIPADVIRPIRMQHFDHVTAESCKHCFLYC